MVVASLRLFGVVAGGQIDSRRWRNIGESLGVGPQGVPGIRGHRRTGLPGLSDTNGGGGKGCYSKPDSCPPLLLTSGRTRPGE